MGPTTQTSAAVGLTPGARARSLAAVLSTVFGVGLCIGMATPLVSLTLESRGYSSSVIGLVAGAYAAAVLVAGPVVPWATHRIGPLAALFLGTAVSAAALALFPFAAHLAVWLVLRMAMGAANAFDWVVSETWINSLATEANRGRVVALYATVWGGGIAGGPLVLHVVGTAGHTPFVVGAAIMALAFLPVLAARRIIPPITSRYTSGALIPTVATAPRAMAAALLAGLGEGSFFALFPVYAIDLGTTASTAVLLVAVFAAGNLALQPPIGWLADRGDRGRLLLGVATMALICPILLPFAFGWQPGLWVTVFLWGGAVAGFYTVGLILLGQRFAGGDIASANTAFIMTYTFGMMVGPALCGLAMRVWAPHGLVATMALLAGLFAAFAAYRRGRS